MCRCPEPLQPPNDQIKKCRFLLQGLAASQFIIAILALLAEDFGNMIIYFLFIFALYIAWTQFHWCSVLIVFLFSFINCIQFTIVLIGLIQHGQLFNKEIFVSLYVLIATFYFPVAIIISHYAYKHFKNLGSMQMGFDMGLGMNNNGGGGARAEGNYSRIEERVQNNEQTVQNRENKKNEVFKGQGIRIG